MKKHRPKKKLNSPEVSYRKAQAGVVVPAKPDRLTKMLAQRMRPGNHNPLTHRPFGGLQDVKL